MFTKKEKRDEENRLVEMPEVKCWLRDVGLPMSAAAAPESRPGAAGDGAPTLRARMRAAAAAARAAADDIALPGEGDRLCFFNFFHLFSNFF